MERSEAHLPAPPSERASWAVAIALGLLGVTVLTLVLSGIIGGVTSGPSVAGPPPVLAVTPTPAPAGTPPQSGVSPRGTGSRRPSSPAGSAAAGGRPAARPILGNPSPAEQGRDLAVYEAQTSTLIPGRWMAGFYPIYSVAQQTFGVNWLLIASIHKQESAFSTAPSTYHGLNFLHCCGGPMQFNVTNGPVTTWQLVSNSYVYGRRPAVYDHQTTRHPSIYDDFDAIMAAAHLLSADGASYALDGSAWNAAYDYYGHDATGVTYADQVLARAISWSQHGFCVNCGLESAMVQAVHAAYGAPVAASYEAATIVRAKPSQHGRR